MGISGLTALLKATEKKTWVCCECGTRVMPECANPDDIASRLVRTKRCPECDNPAPVLPKSKRKPRTTNPDSPLRAPRFPPKRKVQAQAEAKAPVDYSSIRAGEREDCVLYSSCLRKLARDPKAKCINCAGCERYRIASAVA